METTKKFTDFNLRPALLDSLKESGWESPTPVQELTIGPILEGKDLFAQAKTGSGKTGSFAIPLVESILRERENPETQEKTGDLVEYLILTPTRELAQQIEKVLSTIGLPLGIQTHYLIGGENIEKQREGLEKAHIVVATPGRMCDILRQNYLSLAKIRGIVFDEVDRLFDMGFKKDLEDILSQTSKERQLVMVSATRNLDVLQTAYKFHADPLEIRLSNDDDVMVNHIEQEMVFISGEEKMPYLVGLLRKDPDAYALIFCNTQFQTHLVAEWLTKMNFKARPISGRLPQNKRSKLMEDFRSKEVCILVCTDVAARGLDIEDVTLVVNYDLPNEAANFVHRIGRTGRAGKSGKAYSFCAYEDCESLDAVTQYIGQSIPKADVKDEDLATDLCPKPYIDSKTLKVVSREERSRKYDNKNKKRPLPHKDAAEKIHKEKPMVQGPAIEEIPEKTFEVIAYSLDKALVQAQSFFKTEDTRSLSHKVLSEGRKKFFFFGPRVKTFSFTQRPQLKKLILPFVISLLQKANLKLYASVHVRSHHVTISFKGKDEGLLLRNGNELLHAIEHVTKLFISKKLKNTMGVKVTAKCDKFSRDNMSEKDLVKLLESSKQKVLDQNKPVLMKSLSAANRRIIHQNVQKDPRFESTSIGDGAFKRIKISLAHETA